MRSCNIFTCRSIDAPKVQFELQINLAFRILLLVVQFSKNTDVLNVAVPRMAKSDKEHDGAGCS